MKKGDLRKEEIIRAAEKLFFTKGYESTSVQDVLDALSMSKGGFYHYFDSKIALLKAIAQMHGQQRLEKLKDDLISCRQAVRKADMILSEAILLNHTEIELNALIIRIGYLEGDVTLLEHTREMMLEPLCDMLNAAIAEGVKGDAMFTRIPGHLGRILIRMAYDASDEVCRMLAFNSGDADCVMHVADILNAYRECMENLLGAKMGSIELFNLEHLLATFRQTAEIINRMEAEQK